MNLTANHLTLKILSFTLILWGSFGLFLDLSSLQQTISSYNHPPDQTQSFTRSQINLLSQLFLVSLVNAVSTGFGVFLIFKPARLRQLTNLILGFGLLLISSYLRSHYDTLVIFLSRLK